MTNLMSITSFLPTYPPIALDPARLIAEVFATLPEAKRKTIKPENLRSLTIDAWYWKRDNWICDVGELAQQTVPTITDQSKQILDALYQVMVEIGEVFLPYQLTDGKVTVYERVRNVKMLSAQT